MSIFQNIDVKLFWWFNSWVGVSPFFDWAIIFRAEYLLYFMFVALAASVIFTVPAFPKFAQYRKRNFELFILALVSATIARFIITEAIRFFYNRPRPFEVLEDVHQLISHGVGGSFPSGHAALSFAVATAISFYYPKTSILFFAASASIGASRVAAGVHWPSDIFGGVIVGIGTALALRWTFLRFRRK